jgi:hypothetical protein
MRDARPGLSGERFWLLQEFELPLASRKRGRAFRENGARAIAIANDEGEERNPFLRSEQLVVAALVNKEAAGPTSDCSAASLATGRRSAW